MEFWDNRPVPPHPNIQADIGVDFLGAEPEAGLYVRDWLREYGGSGKRLTQQMKRDIAKKA